MWLQASLRQCIYSASNSSRSTDPQEKQEALCWMLLAPNAACSCLYSLSYCMCTSRNLAKPQQSCTSWRSRKGRGISPSGNPQKRFTQPLLINLSRALGQLFRCGKLVIKNFFFLVQITGSIAGPGLELFLCPITRQYQFSQQSFPRSRRNLGQSRIRRP